MGGGMELMESTIFKTKIIPRYRDLDTLGHVNNAVFFTYLEIARTEYFVKHFIVEDPRNFPFVVVHAAINYRRPITMHDVVECYMAPTHVGRSSWTFGYVIKNVNGTIHADGTTVQVHVDPITKKSKTLPQELRRVFEHDLDANFIERLTKGDLHENKDGKQGN